MATTFHRDSSRCLKCRGLLTMREVLEVLRVSRLTLSAWVKAGRFPAPVDLGIRRSLWRVSDVDRALAEGWPPKAAAPDAARTPGPREQAAD
jgi:predicted DNA-binding transcriptional regulator AlpA